MDISLPSDKVVETLAENATEENQATKQEETYSKFLQLEDSTLDHLPIHIEHLLNNLPSKSQTDLLIGLVYCIAVETGFADIQTISTESTSIGNSSITIKEFSSFWGFSFNLKFVKNILQTVPQTYDDLTTTNHNLYKLKLNLINFSIINCLLIGIQTGEYLILTLTIDHLAGKSICLSIPRYVLSKTNIIKPNIFRNLKELSYILKEKLFIPTRNTLMEESNKLYPGLNGLPIELLNIILKYLKLKQIQILSKTCWKMRCCCVDYYELIYKPNRKPFGSKSGDSDSDNKTTRSNRSAEPTNIYPNRPAALNIFRDSHYLN